MSSRHKLNRCEGVGNRKGTCMGEVRCMMGIASRIIVDSWASLFFFPSVYAAIYLAFWKVCLEISQL
jgi:hypothetical protein